MICFRRASGDFEDAVDLDEASQRQHTAANGEAGMFAGITEGGDHQVRRAVDDGRLLREIGGRGDEAAELASIDTACPGKRAPPPTTACVMVRLWLGQLMSSVPAVLGFSGLARLPLRICG